MEHNEFALVISDMGRKDGEDEGYALLDEIRKINNEIPYLIYTASMKQESIIELLKRGGQGYTNSPGELIDLVIKILLNN